LGTIASNVGAVQQDLEDVPLVFHQSCGAGQLDHTFRFHLREAAKTAAGSQEILNSLFEVREVVRDLGHRLKAGVTRKGWQLFGFNRGRVLVLGVGIKQLNALQDLRFEVLDNFFQQFALGRFNVIGFVMVPGRGESQAGLAPGSGRQCAE
jgi:hypothetical protein